MKHIRRITAALVLLLAFVMVVPAFAQNTATVTVSESTINSSFRVTSPYRRSVSNLNVDLQAGQVVITATITLRNKTTGDASLTVTPAVSNGRLNWTATSATWNGTAATGDVLATINRAIASSWKSYIRGKAGTGHLTDVTITDTDITFNFASTR